MSSATLSDDMEPQFNLEETIGRTVGRRRPPAALAFREGLTPDDVRAWHEAFPRSFVPRGVYRFSSHEEADAWLMSMITRPARNPASPR